MAQKIFSTKDFTKTHENEYQLEYSAREIGGGSDLIVERLTEKGIYETLQTPLRRSDDKISSFGINHLTEEYCLTIKILKIKKSLQEWRPQKTQMMKKNFIS
ncbi:hypothetical protein [uncultured Chryseobacterium sp.]|uniref:hypothetical protein n=1 Tax=uncultured Chryseobacterium sp. TaxID=259322 RepID=UPI00258FC79E|nr:hypothetical protein [uncultured Chryseobacterium sp.]